MKKHASIKHGLSKYAILAAGVAVIFGFLHALPLLGTPANLDALFSAARGIAAANGLEGFGSVSLLDRAAGWLWTAGGGSWLAAGQWLETFLFWTALSLALLMAAGWISRRATSPRFKVLVPAAAVLVLAASCLPALWRGVFHRAEPDLALSAPVELAEAVRLQAPGTVFSSPTALPHLLLLAPGTTGRLTPQAAAELSARPAKWREALRKNSWTAVVLSGPAAECRPLLEHLLASPGWRLARVSNHGYLFLREPGPAAAPLNPETFHLASDRETAIYLAQIAERYEALRQTAEARACMAKALKYAPQDADVLAHAASLEATRGRWQDAIVFCNKALKAKPDAAFPKLLKALALFETGQAEKAESLARDVISKAPNDLYTLFLYARICRTLNDYAAEAETLEKIIKVSRATTGQVQASYYIHLGQAYAKQGRAKEALRSYRTALQDAELGETLAKEVRDAVQTIEEKSRP